MGNSDSIDSHFLHLAQASLCSWPVFHSSQRSIVMVQTNPNESSTSDHLERIPYPLANSYNGNQKSPLLHQPKCHFVEASLQLVKVRMINIPKQRLENWHACWKEYLSPDSITRESVACQSDSCCPSYQILCSKYTDTDWGPSFETLLVAESPPIHLFVPLAWDFLS